MRKMFLELAHRLEAGGSAVLITVTDLRGSAPRGPGAMMAVFADGATLGTVGGGNLEYQAVAAAKTLKSDTIMTCVLTVGGDLQMACGGEAELLLCRLGPEDAPLFRALVEADGRGECKWLLLRLVDGKAALRLADGPEAGWYALEAVRAGTVYLFGGGHVACALAKVLTLTGFRVTVFDDRPEFADPARFPAGVRTVCGDFSQIISYVNLSSEDYAAVMTRGHEADTVVLRQLLGVPLRYLGCMGSRRKLALCREQLFAEGFTETQWNALHGPIGLAIGAQTPEEIAVAVAAELIAVRAG